MVAVVVEGVVCTDKDSVGLEVGLFVGPEVGLRVGEVVGLLVGFWVEDRSV